MDEVGNYVSDQAEDMTEKATKDAAKATPAALPPEVMDSDATTLAAERALHLRVLAAMLGGHADDSRVEEALGLAQEVYELELTTASLEGYRSSS